MENSPFLLICLACWLLRFPPCVSIAGGPPHLPGGQDSVLMLLWQAYHLLNHLPSSQGFYFSVDVVRKWRFVYIVFENPIVLWKEIDVARINLWMKVLLF